MKKHQEHTANLRKLSVDELREELAKARESVRDLSFKASQNRLKTVRELRKQKREIARMLTIISEKSA